MRLASDKSVESTMGHFSLAETQLWFERRQRSKRLTASEAVTVCIADGTAVGRIFLFRAHTNHREIERKNVRPKIIFFLKKNFFEDLPQMRVRIFFNYKKSSSRIEFSRKVMVNSKQIRNFVSRFLSILRY